MTLPPGFSRMSHHRQDGVVELFIFVVQKDKFGPQVRLLCSAQDLSIQNVKPWGQEVKIDELTFGMLTLDQNSSKCSRSLSGL